MTAPPPVRVTQFTAVPSVPRVTGETVTWRVSASGGVGPLQYRFWLLEPSGSWRVLREWGAANAVSWTPLTPGRYAMQVWIRSAGSAAAYEAWSGIGPFTVANGPVTVVSLTPDLALPIGPGAPLTWTATVAGGGAPVEYRFWRFNYATRVWTLVQDYGTANRWTWTPTGSDLGRYCLQVWVRRVGSTSAWEAWRSSVVFNVASVPLSVTLSSNQTTLLNVPANTPITWRARVSGTVGPLEYQFWRYSGRTGTWVSGGEYSAADSYTWVPTASESGSAALQVWVRRTGSTNAYDTWAGTGHFLIAP